MSRDDELGPGMKDYTDAEGRQVKHRIQFMRENISACDFPFTEEFPCMCGEEHKISMDIIIPQAQVKKR